MIDLGAFLRRYGKLLVLLAIIGIVIPAASTAVDRTQFESRASLLAIELPTVIEQWFRSQQAATEAVAHLGPASNATVLAANWDPSAMAWKAPAPSRDTIASAIRATMSVDLETRTESMRTVGVLRLVVRTANGEASREIADGYLRSLDVLRPFLVNVSMQQLIDQYAEQSGQAPDDASVQRAANISNQKVFWMFVDDPEPGSAVPKSWVRRLAVGGVLGFVAAVTVALLWEAVRHPR